MHFDVKSQPKSFPNALHCDEKLTVLQQATCFRHPQNSILSFSSPRSIHLRFAVALETNSFA
jgi:hypothetical protein